MSAVVRLADLPARQRAAVSAILAASEARVASSAHPAPRARQAPTSRDPAPSAPALWTADVPWDALMPDNNRHAAVRGRLIATARYRRCKAAVTAACAAGLPGVQFGGPVMLDVALIEPDRRRRDVANYAKLIGDALTAAGVLADDSQIAHATFRRAGLDRINPRAVLTLTPLTP